MARSDDGDAVSRRIDQPVKATERQGVSRCGVGRWLVCALFAAGAVLR